MTAKPGIWRGAAKITYTYQWYSCTKAVTSVIKTGKVPVTCKKISNATKSTFKLTTKQKKSYVSVLVTASNRSGRFKVQTASRTAVK